MRWLMAAALTAVTAAAAIVPAAPAAAQDVCFELWVARNSIYKANGYCFRTARAISYFGNAGCAYDWEGAVPLSARERREVARIQAQERAYGCR